MAIKLKQTDNQSTPPLEYFQGTAGETFKAGEALVISGGKLTKCGQTAKPSYICAADVSIPSGSTGAVACIRVHQMMVFETTWSTAAATINVGDKVTLNTDGLQVTASTTSGVAEVVSIEGTAAGDRVCVRF